MNEPPSTNAATSSKDKPSRGFFGGKKKPKPSPELSPASTDYDAEMQREIEAIEAIHAKREEDRQLQILNDEELAWQMQQEENHLAEENIHPLPDSEGFGFITPSLPPKPIAYTAPYLPVNGIDVSTPPVSFKPEDLTPPALFKPEVSTSPAPFKPKIATSSAQFKPDAVSSPTSPGLKPDEQIYKPNEESHSPPQSRPRVSSISPTISVQTTPAYVSPPPAHFSTPATPFIQRQPPAPVQSVPVFPYIQTPVPQPAFISSPARIPAPTPVPVPQVPMYPPPQDAAAYPPPQGAAYPPIGYDRVHPPATNYTDTSRTANYGFSMLYINRNQSNMSVVNSASMVDGKVSVVDSVSDGELPQTRRESVQMNVQRRTENDDPVPPPRRRIMSMYSEKEQVDLPSLPSSTREGTFVIKHQNSEHSLFNVDQKRPIPPPRRHSSAKLPSFTRPAVNIRPSSGVGHSGDNDRGKNSVQSSPLTFPPNGGDDDNGEENRPIPPQRHRPKSTHAGTFARTVSDEIPMLAITTVTSVPARPNSTPVISRSEVELSPDDVEEELHFTTPLQAKLTIPQRNRQSSFHQIMPIARTQTEDPFSDKSEVFEEEPPASFRSTSQESLSSATPSWVSQESFSPATPSWVSPSFMSSQTPPSLPSTPSWTPPSLTSFQTPPPSFTSSQMPPFSSSVLSQAPSPRPPKPRRPLPSLPMSPTSDRERNLPPIPTPVSSHLVAPPRKNLMLPQNAQRGALQMYTPPPSVSGSPLMQYDAYTADEGWSQADAEKYLAEEDYEFGYLRSDPSLEPTSPSSNARPGLPLKVTNPPTSNMRHIIVDSINRGTSLWIKVHPTDTGRQLANRIGVIATFSTRRVTAIYTTDGRSVPLNNTPLFSNWDDVASFTDGEQWRIEYGELDRTVAGKIKEAVGNSVLSMVPKGWKPVPREPRDERMDRL